jgi:hypothetical protein
MLREKDGNFEGSMIFACLLRWHLLGCHATATLYEHTLGRTTRWAYEH